MKTNIMYQLKEEFLGTNEANSTVLKEEAYDIAYERFAKTSEDEEILTAAMAENEHNGFLMGFKCAMLLKKECGMI